MCSFYEVSSDGQWVLTVSPKQKVISPCIIICKILNQMIVLNVLSFRGIVSLQKKCQREG